MKKRNARKVRSGSRRLFAQPFFPERCVIVVPGQDFEVSTVFKSWIYDEPEENNSKSRVSQHPNTISNQGMIEALRG
jgi:hypothetical protein